VSISRRATQERTDSPLLRQPEGMRVVPVARDHHTAVAELNRVAFRGDEGELVKRLREERLMLVELVAIDGNEVVGHILFSRLAVEVDGRPVMAASLAPMAVRAYRQREGIGAALIRKGLEALLAQACEAAIVLGHSGYYPRFGFSAALARKLAAPFKGENFMALELTPVRWRETLGQSSAFGLVRKP
jgi:putative acetyltransferase